MNKLKILRKERGIRQEEIAKSLGISQSMYSILERGDFEKEKNFNKYLDLMEGISKVLNCSLAELLKEDEVSTEQISLDTGINEGQIVINVTGSISKETVALKLLETAADIYKGGIN